MLSDQAPNENDAVASVLVKAFVIVTTTTVVFVRAVIFASPLLNFNKKDLGLDGHPKRGKNIPLLKGYKRMFAGANLHFKKKIYFEDKIKKITEIKPLLKKKSDNKNIYFDALNEENLVKGIFLGSHWNYGHWLFNHLARLYYCQSSYKDCHIIVNNSLDSDKFRILKYFNIADENIKILKHQTKAKDLASIEA